MAAHAFILLRIENFWEQKPLTFGGDLGIGLVIVLELAMLACAYAILLTVEKLPKLASFLETIAAAGVGGAVLGFAALIAFYKPS
jgi:hypothetical protein